MRYSPEANHLPVGMQSFEKLRESNCVYVDKTENIYNLITQGTVYFLSRPRRFGKSLLISTLDALFRGRKELFQGTWIENADYQWPKHPVIRIDMTDTKRVSVEAFNDSLVDRLAEIADSYDVEIFRTGDASRTLSKLIKALEAKQGKVVVLIDEYDKPILDNVTNAPLAESMRNVLREFYSILKSQDEHLRFVMLTGITKFSSMSVFSGLNNLEDISMASSAATLLGYTQTELEHVFAPWIKNLAQTHSSSIEEQLQEIKRWYNGYQFSQQRERVYNPFSTLVLFKHHAYDAYWFATGTANFLIDVIKQQHFAPQDIDHLVVSRLDLESREVADMRLVALLYQTGYLTIKSYHPKTRKYQLGYPNFEVEESFSHAIMERFSGNRSPVQAVFIEQITNTLDQGDYARLFTMLQTFLASIPYDIHYPYEKHFQGVIYLIFRILGFDINVEVSTNIGRIDAVIELEDRVLVFEFKIDQTAQSALQQIHDNHYYQPYQNQDKEIILFGVNFSTSERNITEWQQEAL